MAADINTVVNDIYKYNFAHTKQYNKCLTVRFFVLSTAIFSTSVMCFFSGSVVVVNLFFIVRKTIAARVATLC